MKSANDIQLERLLMVEEVADLLRVPVSWVYRYADDLGAYRVGKYLRFSWDRVLEALERSGKGKSPNGSPTQRR
jgi:excisionase family DNA binding protein